jgi:hypothetical protein
MLSRVLSLPHAKDRSSLFSRIARFTGVTAAAAAVLAPAALAAAPPKKVGTTINLQSSSLGALKPNTPVAKVRSIMGKPDDQDNQGFSGNSANLQLAYARYGLSLEFWQGTQGGSPKLSRITISSPQYRTSKGIAVNSSVSQLQRAYGAKIKCFHGSPSAGGPFCNYEGGRSATTFWLRGSSIFRIDIVN